MPSKPKKTKQPQTTAQQLSSLIKSARDIMRKDKGLSGDLDRLPMLTWVMFFKFLDDLEQLGEERARIAGKSYRPVIAAPYRWRDWAAKEDGITGDELKAFISNDEIIRLDEKTKKQKKAPGLFAYLRTLQADRDNPTDPRRTVATVFKEVSNRMQSGYLLRDVINKVNGIHFNSSEEIHTLGHLYESMLKEMRDAAGDSGEFYTPRPVVRFMVEVVNPRLGETVLDPACGTGGFLAEAFSHLEKQCRTVQQQRKLQESSIYGGEAKPLPFLLAQMNLLLHGLQSPQISSDNSLKIKVTEIGDRDRVDIILTNPPFGGEEERGILGNFPEDKQTAETALLFLQLIMRKLRRPPKPGRAAVIVPNGILFGDGIAARVKEELLLNYNLHTIVRLPNGVFAPYTSIPSNLLFFDRSGATQEIWFYEMPLPQGRKSYSKTAPMQYEEFADCLAWWSNRVENDHAWKINIGERISEALAAATPHWEAAQQADAKAKALVREIKAISDRIQKLKRGEIPLLQSAESAQQTENDINGLETQLNELRSTEAAERERARAEQVAGDAIYWPVFNLDIKNPSTKQDYKHLPPEQLASDILLKEQRIIELMMEIKSALAE